MQIKVWTKQPNHFIRATGQVLQERECSQAAIDALLNGHFDGDMVMFTDLSVAQFTALEDTAVRMGLAYDGLQA